jgi:hypothetical protein
MVPGKWQGNMDREQLMGHGYIAGRGLLQAHRRELGALLVAGRKALQPDKGWPPHVVERLAEQLRGVGQGAC